MIRMWLVIFGTLLFGIESAWAQASASIQPTVLIQANKGTGPGEFYGAGERGAILGPVVDDNGNIYILATYNNCLQQYDPSGRYLGCITIASSEQTTAEQRRKEPLLPRVIPTVNSIAFENGDIYALQILGDSKPSSHLLRLQGGAFVVADSDKNAEDIKRRITNRDEKREQLLDAALARLKLSKQQFVASHQLEKEGDIQSIYFDAANNVWVISYWGLRVYDAAGRLIYQDKWEWTGWVTYKLSHQGNLYVLRDDHKSVRVTRYSLQGK